MSMDSSVGVGFVGATQSSIGEPAGQPEILQQSEKIERKLWENELDCRWLQVGHLSRGSALLRNRAGYSSLRMQSIPVGARLSCIGFVFVSVSVVAVAVVAVDALLLLLLESHERWPIGSERREQFFI